MKAIKDLLQRIMTDRENRQGTWIGIDESHIILNALEKSERIETENAELREKLEKAVEFQFSNGDEVYAIMDTLLYTGVIPVTIKSADVVYEVFDGEQVTTQHRTRIFATCAEAEARFKKLQGGWK